MMDPQHCMQEQLGWLGPAAKGPNEHWGLAKGADERSMIQSKLHGGRAWGLHGAKPRFKPAAPIQQPLKQDLMQPRQAVPSPLPQSQTCRPGLKALLWQGQPQQLRRRAAAQQ